MVRKRFPTLATIVFVFAVFWLLSELGILTIDIPWLPLILAIIALGWIVNRFIKE
jgi:hypothetical protein